MLEIFIVKNTKNKQEIIKYLQNIIFLNIIEIQKQLT